MINAPRWLQWLALVYLVGAVIYMVYCEETQTGLVGYVMALEMERWGSTSGGLAFGIGLFVVSLPLFALAAVLGKFVPGIAAPAGGYGVANTANREISWKKVFGISAIPLLITAAAVPVIYFVTQAALHETVYKVDLDDASAPLPKGGALVAVQGVIARRYVASYRYGNHTHSTDHSYAPFTASTWKPGDPIQLIAHETASIDNWDQQFTAPYDFSRSGPVVIRGRLSKSLPVAIERKFKAAGLATAPSFLVVEQASFPDAQSAEFLPIIAGMGGIGLTVFTFYVMALLRFKQRKRRARGAHA